MQTSGIDLALLRFALQHTDSPNVAETKVKPEDYEWLREAIKSYETDAQKMKKLLEIVKKEGLDMTEEQKRAALEELQFFVEDLDNASGVFSIHYLYLLLCSYYLRKVHFINFIIFSLLIFKLIVLVYFTFVILFMYSLLIFYIFVYLICYICICNFTVNLLYYN